MAVVSAVEEGAEGAAEPPFPSHAASRPSPSAGGDVRRRNRLRFAAVRSLELSRLPPRMQEHAERRYAKAQLARSPSQPLPPSSAHPHNPATATRTSGSSASGCGVKGLSAFPPKLGEGCAANSARVRTGWRANSVLEVKNSRLSTSNWGLLGQKEQLEGELLNVRRENAALRRQLRGTAQALPASIEAVVDRTIGEAVSELKRERENLLASVPPTKARFLRSTSGALFQPKCTRPCQYPRLRIQELSWLSLPALLCRKSHGLLRSPCPERALIAALGAVEGSSNDPSNLSSRELIAWLLREIPLVEELADAMANAASRIASERAEWRKATEARASEAVSTDGLLERRLDVTGGSRAAVYHGDDVVAYVTDVPPKLALDGRPVASGGVSVERQLARMQAHGARGLASVGVYASG
ncbi:MAG: hypothetical protein SGPRY_013203 [Prymnesium sp.]